MGSAIQPKLLTVQGKLEEVLHKLNIKEKTIFSGRTDRDVHATKQVVSFHLPTFWSDTQKLKDTLNSMLPKEINVLHVNLVDKDFHARFSAKKREYRYLICTKQLTPFTKNYFHYEDDLDIKKMKEASKLFIGEHDFKSFSKMGSDPNSTIRTIYKIDIYKHKEYIVIKFQANAYLRSQIRMIVATLLKISKDELSLTQLQEQLNNTTIHSTSLAPPFGLYLSRIIY